MHTLSAAVRRHQSWLGIAGVTALALVIPAATAIGAAPQSFSEQQGHHGVNTFLNYHNASGLGPRIDPATWVEVSCKVYDPFIESVNPDGYWYRIASSPWNDQYYAVANTFWNGDIPGQKPYKYATDMAVPVC